MLFERPGPIVKSNKALDMVFASMAIKSPADSLAMRFLSFRRTAQSLTFLSTLRVDAQ